MTRITLLPLKTWSLLSVLTPFAWTACSSDPADLETAAVAQSQESLELALPALAARVETGVLHQYDDAPRTPDADDPAIWVNSKNPAKSLVLGTLKDGGLNVYNLRGEVVQTILPPNRPGVAAEDPAVAGPQPEAGTAPCDESEEGETYGRFNNVDVIYDFMLTKHGRRQKVDIAVVTDRGCDRLRTFVIDGSSAAPLRDVTAASVPRAFPKRFERPSPYQSPGATSQVVSNPLDDQSTAYGITLSRVHRGHGVQAFVTQRSRATVAQFDLFSTRSGKVSYKKTREFNFDPVFSLRAPQAKGSLDWTPCREDAADDPQFEGVVVDAERNTLYAAQELVGIWRVPLHRGGPFTVDVPARHLFEPTKSFGVPYWAVPDEDEFSCETEEPESLPPGTVSVPGNAAYAGKHLEADAEGLAIYPVGRRSGYLIASSQGDDTFHVFDRDNVKRHLGAFQVEGTGETDGHSVAKQPLGSAFPFGLFVTQNGDATAPESTDDINGYEYDGSTQFQFLGWEQIAAELGLDIAAK